MSTASTDGWRAAGMMAPRAASLLRGWMPLHGWSKRRRMAVGALIAAIACVLATLACVTTDLAGAAAARGALETARRELVEGERAQRALPALRQAASAISRETRRGGGSADDARDVSELAAASGISLVSLAPDAPGTQRASAAHEAKGAQGKKEGPGNKGGSGVEAFHVLKLTAQGDFTRLRGFLRGLAHAPVLIVPTETAIKRNGSQLSLAATLSVFDALPSPPAMAADDAATAADPFAATRGDDVRAGDGLRLAGLMQDRTHAVALIETPRGTDAVERGGTIEGEKVVRIAMPEITLASGGRTRTLKWTEDER
jgi:hypothetical protein